MALAWAPASGPLVVDSGRRGPVYYRHPVLWDLVAGDNTCCLLHIRSTYDNDSDNDNSDNDHNDNDNSDNDNSDSDSDNNDNNKNNYNDINKSCSYNECKSEHSANSGW